MITLRPYQTRCIETTRKAVAGGSRAPLIVAPTGSGKTTIGVSIASSALTKGGRVLWLAHRRELVEQTVETLARAGVNHVSVLRADDDRADPSAPVVVASVQTMIARSLRPDASVVVLDEAHHYVAQQWGALASDYRDAIRVGLTATPERGDGTALGDLFDGLIAAASYSELITAGHLVPCEVVAPSSRLQGQIAVKPWTAYREHGESRPAVIFAATVIDAVETSQQLAGCRVVHGTMSDRDRDAAVAGFQSGACNILANCYVLTEGWDAPRVEVCIIARGCSHPSTYLQIVGRVLRPFPGKRCALVVDLAGIVHEHGYPTDDREYSLTGEAIRRSVRAESIWQCLYCGATRPTTPIDRICPRCAEPLPPPKSPEVIEAELRKLIAWECQCGEAYRTMPIACAKCGALSPRGKRVDSDDGETRSEYLARMQRTADAKGYKPGWAAWKYKTKYGQWPPRRGRHL